MNALLEKIQKRPGQFQALIVTGLAVASSWGIDLNGEQVAGVVAFTAVLIGFLTDQGNSQNSV
jgi:hypothetical protein|tara:strand:+ start:329 stop:517 length:189 start_codon:yes stop_codon:yes gene_type:complete